MKKISISKEAQHARLLQALFDAGSVTTSEARESLAVMHPAGRIRELRAAGWPIYTDMVLAPDDAGVTHRQACYVLIHHSGVTA